jgi:serine/threonine protein kinase
MCSYVVTELMQADMHWLVRSPQSLTPAHVKFFVYQILKGLKFIHSAGVIHRDIKPGNVLINKDCTVKICDFGLARGMVTPSGDAPELTEYVVTRWYRAPEVLLQSHFYDGAVDIWSVGCIFVELFNRKPLFPGRDYIDQMNRVLNVMGTPSDDVLARFASQQAIRWMKFQPFREATPIASLIPSVDDPDAIDLLTRMFTLDPEARITAEDALRHPYFAALHDESAERTCDIQFNFSYEYPEITTEEIKSECFPFISASHVHIPLSHFFV